MLLLGWVKPRNGHAAIGRPNALIWVRRPPLYVVVLCCYRIGRGPAN